MRLKEFTKNISEEIYTSTFDSDFVTKAKILYNKGDKLDLINHINQYCPWGSNKTY